MRDGPLDPPLAGSWLWLLLAILATGCHHSDQEARTGPCRPTSVLDFATLYGQELRRLPRGRWEARPGASAERSDLPGDRAGCGRAQPDLRRTAGDAHARLREEQGGPLTDEQVKALAAGIKPRWGSARASREPICRLTPSRRPETKSAASRSSPAPAPPATGQTARARGMAGAIHDPVFLALISDQCLRRYAITGRPDLGMPDFAGKDGRDDDFQPLTSAEIDRPGRPPRALETGRSGQTSLEHRGPMNDNRDRDPRSISQWNRRPLNHPVPPKPLHRGAASSAG